MFDTINQSEVNTIHTNYLILSCLAKQKHQYQLRQLIHIFLHM
jgi:hypothetical protein